MLVNIPYMDPMGYITLRILNNVMGWKKNHPLKKVNDNVSWTEGLLFP